MRLAAVLGVAVLPLALAVPATAAGVPAGASTARASGLSPSLSVTSRLSARRYVAAGDRAYEVGSEEGRYPAMGFHTRGEMGGIWTAPLKLLDGLWFGLDGAWVRPATRFTSGYGYVKMDLPGPAGLTVSRTDFVPDGRRAVVVGLTMRAATARTVRLKVDAHSELMSAYPWGQTVPDQTTFNLADRARVTGRTLVFQDQGRPPVPHAAAHDWAALVGTSLAPTGSATGRAFRGPQDPPVTCPVSIKPDKYRCDDTAYGKGAGGQLKYAVRLAAGQSRTVWVTVAGSDSGLADAQREYAAASADPGRELRAKVATRLALAARTKVDLPGDPALASAVEWGKQNLADLTQEARNLVLRPTVTGTKYPAPVGRLARIRFEGAGYPDYPWLFATDGEYSAFALVAAGQFATAEDHLRALRNVSQIVNSGSGKVVHETVTTGDVYFGLNSDPGDLDETAKFPGDVALLWRWTGDNAFRDEMYPFAKKNLEYLFSKSNPDRDLWPDGNGNEEATGIGPEQIDVTAYTIRGLYDLADMAASKSDMATQRWALAKATAMTRRFEGAWWMPRVPQYADSLQDPGNVATQQRFWIGVTPMEVELHPHNTTQPGLAAAAHANPALSLRQASCYTGRYGLYEEGIAGCDPLSSDTTGRQTAFTLTTAIMAVGLGNYGRLADQQRYLNDDVRLELQPDEQPGDLPEIAPSPDFVRNIDRPWNERSMVEQAWGQYGVFWPVVHQWLGVDPDLGNGRLRIVPQVPPGQVHVGGSAIRVGSGTVEVTADHVGARWRTSVTAATHAALTVGTVLPTGTHVSSVRLNGATAPYTAQQTNRGLEITVSAPSGRTDSLLITTR